MLPTSSSLQVFGWLILRSHISTMYLGQSRLYFIRSIVKNILLRASPASNGECGLHSRVLPLWKWSSPLCVGSSSLIWSNSLPIIEWLHYFSTGQGLRDSASSEPAPKTKPFCHFQKLPKMAEVKSLAQSFRSSIIELSKHDKSLRYYT